MAPAAWTRQPARPKSVLLGRSLRVTPCRLNGDESESSSRFPGNNRGRCVGPEVDRLYRASESERDPLKRAALFIRMNDIACSDLAVIPLVERSLTTGLNRKLVAPLSACSLNTQQIAYWRRET